METEMDETPIVPVTDGAAGALALADSVTISRAELEGLRKLAAAAQAEGSAVPAAPRTSPETRGQDSLIAKELAARDRKLSELELAFKAAVRDRELATALAGKPLVAGAVTQLIKLWRDDFDAYEDDGLFKVASRDGRTVGQVVNEWLGSAEFSHFCLPTSRGGTSARDVNRSSSAASPPAPKNLGEAVVMKWREESAAKPKSLLKPIGLRRHR